MNDQHRPAEFLVIRDGVSLYLCDESHMVTAISTVCAYACAVTTMEGRVMNKLPIPERFHNFTLAIFFSLVFPSISLDAAEYRFTKIADTAGDYQILVSRQLNNHGVVAFVAYSHEDGALIQTWDDGIVSTLYSQVQVPLLSIVNLSVQLNDEGAVAFLGTVDGTGEGMHIGDGGAFTTVASSNGPLCCFQVVAPSLNNSGQVAFQAGVDPWPAGGYGIFSGSGGPIQTIAHSNEGFDEFGIPAINDSGAVAYFAGRWENPSSWRGYVYYQEVGQPREIVFESDLLWNTGLTMNNSGQILATIQHFDGPELITTLSIVSRQGVTTMADSTGPFHAFTYGERSINDNGNVVFSAEMDNGAKGIFVGPDALADRVLIEGDSQFGGTIDELYVFSGLNNAGQIAFLYRLDTGIRGIAVATPVPEPGLGSVLIAALISLAAARRRYVLVKNS